MKPEIQVTVNRRWIVDIILHVSTWTFDSSV